MAMAIQPLTMEALGSACHMWAKLHRYMLKDVPANVWQKLLTVPILSLQPVDAKQVMGALKAAPHMVKAVAVPPPKPQASKPTSTSAKPLVGAQQ